MFSHARRLRWSGDILGYDIKVEGLADPSLEVGVPGGRELIALVDAFFDGDEVRQESARTNLRAALGDESFVDAATVYGNFEMMNRVAEGVGLPIAPQAIEREADMMRALGLDGLIKDHLR